MNPEHFTSISFPSFGIEFDPPRLFEVGPLAVRLYALCICIGLVLAVYYGCRRCSRFGLKKDDIMDGVLYVTPFAILCARLYYCVFSWEDYAANPISILYIWEGGLAIYGGVRGAIVGVAVFCRCRKIPVTTVLDIVALGFLIGQTCGWWGNFFNREAFGAPTESFFRMGLFNAYTGAWEFYHPTFLYESVWNLMGFVLLHFLSRHRRYDGQVALGYAAWYGLGRAFIEGLRMDSLYWGPFRVSQLLAAASFAAASAVLVWKCIRKPDPARLYANRAE